MATKDNTAKMQAFRIGTDWIVKKGSFGGKLLTRTIRLNLAQSSWCTLCPHRQQLEVFRVTSGSPLEPRHHTAALQNANHWTVRKKVASASRHCHALGRHEASSAEC